MTRSASCTFALLSIVVAGCQAHIDDSATVVAVVAVGPEVERVGILIDDADEPAVSATVGRAKGGFSVSVRPGTSEGSKGSEVWVFDISTPQSRVTFTPSQFSNEPWLLRDDAAAPGGKVAIGNGTSPSVLNATVEGSRLTIRFLQHPWSGSAEVTVNGKRSTIDLYADPGNLKDVTFLAETIGEAVDEGNRRQTLKFVVPHPDSAVPKMTFRAEPAGKLRLESVLVNDRAAELVGEETALWPATSVWRAHKGALLFTVLAILCAAFALAAGSLWRYPLGESSARVLIAAWLAAAMCAVWWSAVSYPGYMTADSLDQWGQAMRGRFTTWHPPFMAMLMKATLVFVNQPIFFTVIQALLFWFSAFWAMSITVKNVRLWLVVLFLLAAHPLFWFYSTTLWKDVWAATMGWFAFGYLARALERRVVADLFRGTIAVSVAICFRYNVQTVAVVPVLISLIAFRSDGWRRSLKRTTVIVLLLMVPVRAIGKLPMVDDAKAMAAWQLKIPYVFGTMIRLDPSSEDGVEARARLDAEFGAGTIDIFRKNYTCACFGERQLGPGISLAGRSAFFDDQFSKLLSKHKTEMLEHRVCSLGHFMQITGAWNPYSSNIDNNSIGLVGHSWLPKSKAIAERIVRKFVGTPFMVHFFFDGILVVALVIGVVRRQPTLIVAGALGLSYLAPYFVLDPCADWRYQLFNYGLALMCLGAGAQAVVSRLSARLAKP